MYRFVEDQCKENLEIVEAGLVWNKDPFLRLKKDVGMPTAQLGQAEATVEESEGGDDKEEEKPQVIPELPKPKRTTSKPDRKGKAIVEFVEKSNKKKPV